MDHQLKVKVANKMKATNNQINNNILKGKVNLIINLKNILQINIKIIISSKDKIKEIINT